MTDVDATELANRVVKQFGGRFSSEAGIDVDGPDGVDRWFLASTLFTNRIDSHVSTRAYRELDRAGVHTVVDLDGTDPQHLVDLLEDAGYDHFDLRAAGRLLHLAHEVQRRYPEGIATVVAAPGDPIELRASLESLPGCGPVTTAAFLRELRRPMADEHHVDPIAERAALHLHLDDDGSFTVGRLHALAAGSGLDDRDLEAALVRVALSHQRSFTSCERSDPIHCALLRRPVH